MGCCPLSWCRVGGRVRSGAVRVQCPFRARALATEGLIRASAAFQSRKHPEPLTEGRRTFYSVRIADLAFVITIILG